MKVSTMARTFASADQECDVIAHVSGQKVILSINGVPVCAVDIDKHLLQVRVVGNMTIDTAKREVTVGKNKVDLTHTEYNLLFCLIDADKTIVKKKSLHSHYWDSHGSSHVVDVHLSNVRRKLQNAGWTSSILTVRGVGFRLR